MSLLEKIVEFPQGFRNFSKDIKLTGVPRLTFLRSEWDPVPPRDTVVTIPYLFYRLVFTLYFLFFLVFSIAGTPEPGFWMLLATNWTFLSQTIYSVLNFGNVFIFWAQEICGKNHPYYHLNVNWFESMIWFTMNLSYSVPQFISIAYWSFIYGASSLVGNVPIGWSLTVHGINAVLAIIDAFIVAAPLNVTHFIYPVLMNGLYLLMTGLYEVAGGPYETPDRPYIYPILNWRTGQLGAVITCIASTLSIIIFHFLFWVLVVVRKHLSSKCGTSSGLDSDNNERKALLDSKI
ncbi:unnamed protein product [Allacma fusca]|uniref:Uncharacterized protein n=1 Tax=Allacma fusca TaxID=39272 RepID=A0A8J2LQR0_9HEXA|nr:unnamed protein product [Allacma fusca]